MERRYVHQWHPVHGDPCVDQTRHWTEIRLTSDELLGMLGCASGSTLLGLHIARDGFTLTVTADEHREVPPCPVASSSASSAVSLTGQPPGSSTPS